MASTTTQSTRSVVINTTNNTTMTSNTSDTTTSNQLSRREQDLRDRLSPTQLEYYRVARKNVVRHTRIKCKLELYNKMAEARVVPNALTFRPRIPQGIDTLNASQAASWKHNVINAEQVQLKTLIRIVSSQCDNREADVNTSVQDLRDQITTRNNNLFDMSLDNLHSVVAKEKQHIKPIHDKIMSDAEDRKSTLQTTPIGEFFVQGRPANNNTQRQPGRPRSRSPSKRAYSPESKRPRNRSRKRTSTVSTNHTTASHTVTSDATQREAAEQTIRPSQDNVTQTSSQQLRNMAQDISTLRDVVLNTLP